MTNKFKKISIIIPVFNEKGSLSDILKKLEMTDFNLEKEIIIVDDCSTDGVDDIYANTKHKVIYHNKNMGKGMAIKTGIMNANGDIILIQDADLEYNPIDYIPMIKLLIEDKADVVYGSRLLNENNYNNFLFHSFLANKFLSLLTRVLYNTDITDMETCYKAMKSDVIKSIQIKSQRFEFEPEITAKLLKKGYKILEIPITYNARGIKQGKKIGFWDGIQAILTLIKYRFVD